MIKKVVLFFIITTLFLNLIPNRVFAVDEVSEDNGFSANGDYQKIILIINQVRGDECCDVGSEKSFVQQIDTLAKNNLKGNFALRYDALLNPAYVDVLKNLDEGQFELGAFLEITPQLAQDAGVLYKGKVTEWYKAQNVYTVGYEYEDRKKIIDKYMEVFFSSFGYYPKFSTAWIMDTDSVNYMNDRYGILAHQITREQWGTDSYTMSGGPVHYPYFASKNWLFVNGGEIDAGVDGVDSKQTLILRQTGSDPMFNYGDNTNSFTTQPNDYALGNRGFDYFRNLKNQLVNQKQNNYGFLLLGLENSMVDKFQDEYSKQVDSIKDDGEIITMKVSQFNQFAKIKNQDVVGIEGSDIVSSSDRKSFWVNAKNYRARFIFKDNQLFLTDLRLLNEDLEDPYNKYVAQDLAFWVTPFIFNASQQYSLSEPTGLTFKENILHELRKKYLPEFRKENFETKSSRNDFLTYFDGIRISDNVQKMNGFSRNENDELVLSWIDKDNKDFEINFIEDQINTNFIISSKDVIVNEGDLISIKKNWRGFDIIFADEKYSDQSISLSVDCAFNSCELTFNQPSDDIFTELREDYYPYLFPEISDRLMDNLESVFYAHNRYAVVGKNPVRFVFIPKDDKGFATSNDLIPEIFVFPDSTEIDLRDVQTDGTTVFDINSDVVGKYEVEFIVGDLINKKETVYFAPDCKKNLTYCMVHPVESTWYLSSMFYTKLRNF